MSSRLEKLKTLLARVEERKNQPRLRAVPPALQPTAPSNEASFAEPATASRVASLPPERPQKQVPTTPLEDAMADLSPTQGLGGVPTPVPGAPGNLELDAFEAPAKPAAARSVSTLPQPVARATQVTAPPAPPSDAFARDPFASSLPPASAAADASSARENIPTPVPGAEPSVPVAPEAEPVALSEASARIAPEPASAKGPIVTAVSPARVEAPKTFGELLERTLALRVRK